MRNHGRRWLAAFAALMAAFLIAPELAAIAGSFNPTSRMVISFSALSSRPAVRRRVTRPRIRPALVASALFAIVVSIDEFTLTWFVAGRTVHTIPIAIFNNTQYGIDPTVAAASTVLIGASAVLIVL